MSLLVYFIHEKTMRIKLILTILSALFLTACSFNKMFLHPTKIDADTKMIKLSSKKDTTYVMVDTIVHQPTFLKNGKDTID